MSTRGSRYVSPKILASPQLAANSRRVGEQNRSGFPVAMPVEILSCQAEAAPSSCFLAAANQLERKPRRKKGGKCKGCPRVTLGPVEATAPSQHSCSRGWRPRRGWIPSDAVQCAHITEEAAPGIRRLRVVEFPRAFSHRRLFPTRLGRGYIHESEFNAVERSGYGAEC